MLFTDFFNNSGARCWVVRVDDLTNAASVEGALKEFEKIDEIAIIAAPGAIADAVQLKVIEHCENMKDRFAIIDGQVTTTIGGVPGTSSTYTPGDL